MHSRGSSYSERFSSCELLNPAGSNLNHSPLACLCVEREKLLCHHPCRVLPGCRLPQTLHLLIEARTEQGAETAGERGHPGFAFSSLANCRGSTGAQAPGLTQLLRLFILGQGSCPFPPGDLLSSPVRFSPKAHRCTQLNTGRMAEPLS